MLDIYNYSNVVAATTGLLTIQPNSTLGKIALDSIKVAYTSPTSGSISLEYVEAGTTAAATYTIASVYPIATGSYSFDSYLSPSGISTKSGYYQINNDLSCAAVVSASGLIEERY